MNFLDISYNYLIMPLITLTTDCDTVLLAYSGIENPRLEEIVSGAPVRIRERRKDDRQRL